MSWSGCVVYCTMICFFQEEACRRVRGGTRVQTCALPIWVEPGHMFGRRPFRSVSGLDLHQTDLPRPSARPWIEPTLPPHHGFDQGRIHPVLPGRRQNDAVLAAFPPWIVQQHRAEGDEQEDPKNPATIHVAVLAAKARLGQMNCVRVFPNPRNATLRSLTHAPGGAAHFAF